MLCSLRWLALVAGASTSARAQDIPARPISYGLEVAFSSGHADRGFLISDRPVIQPVTWLSAGGAEFSLWSSIPLTPNTDRSRPGIVEMELTREFTGKKLTVTPAVRMYFYHDVANRESDHSLEGWLNLSYDVGPFRLYTNHSLDLLTYKGAYFIDAGILREGHVSPGVEFGGRLGAGYGFAKFNYAYADVARRALDRVTAAAWVTASGKNFYVEPHVEFSSIVDSAVRAQVLRPTYVVVRLAVGGQF